MPIDYYRCATEAGLTTLAFTDHTPLPDGRWGTVRMSMWELAQYVGAVDECRVAASGITVLKGLECEYASEYAGFYRDELLGRLELDLLVGAVHWFPHRGGWHGAHGGVRSREELRDYTLHAIRTMESGLFAFLAHPDLFGMTYPEWDADACALSRELLQAAADLGIPLEYNTYGLRKQFVRAPDDECPRPMYPWQPFWELAAEYEVGVVVNSDAHEPEDVAAGIAEGLARVEGLGLTVAEPVRRAASVSVPPDSGGSAVTDRRLQLPS